MRNLILVVCLAFSSIVTASTVTWSWKSAESDLSEPVELGVEQGEFITTEADNNGFYELLDFKLLKSATNPHLEGGSLSGGEFETRGLVYTGGDFSVPTGEIRTGIRLHLQNT